MSTTSNVLKNRVALSRLRFFRNVRFDLIQDQLARCSERSLEPGEVLLTPEIRNTHLYVLTEGRLTVRLDGIDDTPLATLFPGECVGEMSVFEGEYPSAWVQAEETSQVLVIDQETVWSLITESHGVALNLLTILSKRLRSGNLAILMRERNSSVDTLTGVHNRDWMEEMFDREMRRCEMDEQPISLVLLNLDRFSDYQERYGDVVSDQVLRSVASLLQRAIRPGDMMARVGDNEFAILLPTTTADNAYLVATRLRDSINKTTAEDTNYLASITLSGSVIEPDLNESATSVLNRAYALLADAQKQGLNSIIS